MHHMLNASFDEPNLLKVLRENGYFVWWGGKNDLVPGQHGYEEHCDVKFRPDADAYRRWQLEPQPGSHGGDMNWRGDPASDNFFSFYKGKLDKGDAEVYGDTDWAMIYGAIDFIESYDGDKPLCVFLPIGYPHPPYCVEEPWYSMIDRRDVPKRFVVQDWDDKPILLKGIRDGQNLSTWSEARWTELRATYYGMCSRVDHQFGLLCDALRRAEIFDDSAIFFFSDHGDFTGDYGLVEKTQNTFQDCLSRVPFLIKPPNSCHVESGTRSQLVELIDLCATIYDLTDIDCRYWHFGRSLRHLFANANHPHRDAVFTEGGRLRGEIQASERESLSANQDLGLYSPRIRLQVQEGDQLPHTKAAMCRNTKFKYVRRAYELDEFYDLRTDPGETRNLIEEDRFTNEINGMRERLLAWYMETSDVVPFDTDKRNFS